MLKCGCHDHGVERTAFRPSKITAADVDTDIVIAKLSQHLRGGFGQWWDNLTVQTFCTRRASTAAR